MGGIFSKLKVALVYDRVNKRGGAERVLLTLHEMFPKAALYTSVYDKPNASWAKVFPKIYTSFLQKVPFLQNRHELLAWLMPVVFETFDFSEYDLVISVTSEAAKGIITGPNTLHICYCLTPTRYLWSGYQDYFKAKFLKVISKPVVSYLQSWDKIASHRPDKIIAISTEVKRRVKRYYNLDSEIIFPASPLPFVKQKTKKGPGKYFLVVSRLVPYKKVDLAVKAFNQLKLPLVVVGTGSEIEKLKRMSKPNIKFVGEVSDQKLQSYYQDAKALIMPQFEDFGIVSVEAQSFGVPVIAYDKGGVVDTVISGKTGILFNKQDVKELKQIIAKFSKIGFNHSYIRSNAKRFSKSQFQRLFQRSLIRAYLLWRRRNKTVAILQGKKS